MIVPETEAEAAKRSGGVDVIGGFPFASPMCGACREPLVVDNAWMVDGCPCNCVLGTNSLNETRWRLLMQLQQRQSRAVENVKAAALFRGGGIGSGVGDFREAAERAARILADLETGAKAVELVIGPFEVFGLTVPAIPLRFKLAK